MFRPDREPRGEDPLLVVKIAIFIVASAAAFTGMALQQPMVVFGAIVLLGAGFLLRFVRPRRGDTTAASDRVADSPNNDEAPPPRQPPV